MTKPKPDITDPRAIAADFFRKLGGMDGMTKWGKTHRSLAYQLIAKLLAQPLVQNNVNIRNTVVGDGKAREHLEDALMRIIDERQKGSEDPAVYVDGERLRDIGYRIIDGQPQQIEHQPATVDPRLPTPDAVVDAPDAVEHSDPKSPQQGPLFGGSRAEAATGAGQKQNSMYSSVPGLFAGAAVGEGAHDNLSTTEKYLSWSGRERMP